MSSECVQIGDCTLYRGDCLEILPTLPDGSVDAVVTDPPYGMDYDTDSSRFSGGRSERISHRGSDAGAPFPGGIYGDNKSFDPAPWLGFDQVILWGSNHFAQRLAVGTTLVWVKKADHLFGTFLSDAEIAWRKGGRGVYCFRCNHAWHARPAPPNSTRSFHPTEKPLELMEWCVAMTTGSICDPYVGSGTTGVACVRLGRKFIGIEIEESYFRIACKRIERAYADAANPLFGEIAPKGVQLTLGEP